MLPGFCAAGQGLVLLCRNKPLLYRFLMCILFPMQKPGEDDDDPLAMAAASQECHRPWLHVSQQGQLTRAATHHKDIHLVLILLFHMAFSYSLFLQVLI